MRLIFPMSLLLSAAAFPAAAEIALYGEARLGLGYNIDNEGEPDLETKESVVIRDDDGLRTVVTELGGSDDLRAVSRLRFGVTMTGESDCGVSFGASIRADNAHNGGTGPSAATGQTAGDVFVAGAFGRLSYGDVDGADYMRVGDPVENVSLTGLGDFNELPFMSNGGGSDNDSLQFVTDPDGLPTVRYDYDLGGFGLSVSTDRTLDSVGAGASYVHEFASGPTILLGLGYYDFSSFTGDLTNYGEVEVPDGEEWSASLRGEIGAFNAGVGYAAIDAGDLGKLDVLSVGAGATQGPWTGVLYYTRVISGDDLFGEAYDGRDSYGASLAYDLGGGAQVRAGVARSYGADAIDDPAQTPYAPAVEAMTLADFGITMAF